MNIKYLKKDDIFFLEMHISRLCQTIDNKEELEVRLKSTNDKIRIIQKQIYELEDKGYQKHKK
jgi:chaperonin cofactor prefoldin